MKDSLQFWNLTNLNSWRSGDRSVMLRRLTGFVQLPIRLLSCLASRPEPFHSARLAYSDKQIQLHIKQHRQLVMMSSGKG